MRTRASRCCWTCRRGNRVCRRGGPHRRGGVRRLALGCAGRAPPDHACRPAGAFCDALDSEHVAARRADRRRHSKGAAGLRGRFVRQRAQHASRHSRSRRTATSSSRKPERGGCASFVRAELSAGPAQGEIFADGLQRPYGIAFYPSGQDPRFVYVATPDSVMRFPYRSGETKASGPPEKIASLPSGGGHWTRDLAFSPDDKTLFVSVGSGSNVAEGAPRAGRDRASPRRRSAPRSATSSAAPTCSPSILRARTSASTRPAFAIVRALRSSQERARSGAP